MTTTWEFGYLMPNAAFVEPIEQDWLAVVPHNDRRLGSLADRYETVRQLVGRFSDQFGRPIKPAALLVRSDAPIPLDFNAVASFRNIVAMASIIDAWTSCPNWGTGGVARWADQFDFYPFAPTNNYEQLIGISVANMAIDRPDHFVGQNAPHLAVAGHLMFGVDKWLLNTCLRHWKRHFVAGHRAWKGRALFRSLQIACHAARMPAVGSQYATIHDVGISIALWVSAFEILKESRKDHSNLRSVVQLLDRFEWLDSKLKARRYTMYGKKPRVNIASKLYAAVYRARNDFLHGNPVTDRKLFPFRHTQTPNLLHCAPLIYRVALLAFLNVGTSPKYTGSLQRYADARFAYEIQQRGFEEALLAYLQ